MSIGNQPKSSNCEHNRILRKMITIGDNHKYIWECCGCNKEVIVTKKE